MNTTELPVRPDVSAFVARVRELLADLSEEDRLELTEGLEADLTDQVAEHGGECSPIPRPTPASCGPRPGSTRWRGVGQGCAAT